MIVDSESYWIGIFDLIFYIISYFVYFNVSSYFLYKYVLVFLEMLYQLRLVCNFLGLIFVIFYRIRIVVYVFRLLYEIV